MVKIYMINSKLEQAGIATQRVIESVCDDEDDMIEVNDQVHVQVGDGYLTIYLKKDEDNYQVYSATNSNLIDKVKWILSSDSNSL